jgi:hypothetical protein
MSSTLFLMSCLCNASGRFVEHGHLMDFKQQRLVKVQALANMYEKPKAHLNRASSIFSEIYGHLSRFVILGSMHELIPLNNLHTYPTLVQTIFSSFSNGSFKL